MAFIPIIAALAGAAVSASGQQAANNANQQSVVANQQFQQTMSNTSYQRSMADMQAAGLNPMLAFQQGGASTPMGGTASFGNTMSGAPGAADSISSALNQHKFDQDQQQQLQLQNIATQKQNNLTLEKTLTEQKNQANISADTANKMVNNNILNSQAQIQANSAKASDSGANAAILENSARSSQAILDKANADINYHWVGHDQAIARTGNAVDLMGNAASIVKPNGGFFGGPKKTGTVIENYDRNGEMYNYRSIRPSE